MRIRNAHLRPARLTAAVMTALAMQPAMAQGQEAQPEPADQSITLAPLVVEGSTENEGPLGPIIQEESSTATKTKTPIADTARSVAVETRQQMSDKGMMRLEDAFLYTAGMHGGSYGFDSRGNWSSVRGFQPSDYLDGLPFGNDGYYNDTLPEIEMLERVEVLKGPASSLYGASTVGGLVNAVSKRPEEDAFRRMTVEYGTFNRKQISLDATGKLDEGGKILGRIVGFLRDGETQVDYSNNDAEYIAPSVTFRPDANTDITILGRYQHSDFTPDTQFLSVYGTLLPAPAFANGTKVPTSLFVGEPGFDKIEATTYALTLDGSHDFNEVWSLNGTFRYSRSDGEYNQSWWGYANYPTRYDATGQINRSFYMQRGETEMWLGDVNATADFNTGPVDHALLFGVNYSDITFDNDWGICNTGTPCFPAGGTIDPFNPVYTGAPAVTVIDFPSVNFKQTGIYVQDQATILERIVLSAGARWDKFEAADPYGGAGNEDSDISINASLLYRFDSGLRPYVSYAESFLQENYGTTATGSTFDPTRGEQYEIGLKYQPPGTASLFTVALFDITKSNILVQDPANPAFQIQEGEAKSHGIEFEAQTNLGEVYLEANYSFVQTQDESGRVFEVVPKHLASAWATWRPEGAWRGFKLGGGVRYVGPSYGFHYADPAFTVTQRLTVPSYTLGDAMIGYETPDWDLTLNIRNITDEKYVAGADSNAGYWGERRTVVLKLGYNF